MVVVVVVVVVDCLRLHLAHIQIQELQLEHLNRSNICERNPSGNALGTLSCCRPSFRSSHQSHCSGSYSGQ